MPLPRQTKQLILDVINDLLLPYLDKRDDDSQPVVKYIDPPQMHERINKIMIEEGPSSPDDIKTAVQECLDCSVKMGHRNCLNQLFHRADPVAILGDFVTSVMNTSIYTYELAPFITVLELEVVDRFAELLGWTSASSSDDESSSEEQDKNEEKEKKKKKKSETEQEEDDSSSKYKRKERHYSGTMTPGGSIANLYGLACARASKFPHVMQSGWQAQDKPCFFVSESSHYSSKKAAALLGIGYDAMISVPVDEESNTMSPSALREEIIKARARGFTPFAVVITLGTTLTGAIDPISEIVKICQDEQQSQESSASTSASASTAASAGSRIWVHVDGCLGASLIHSPAVKSTGILDGIEKVDSISINPHKMMGSTLQTTMFMTQHGTVQQNSFSTRAQYLFNEDKQYDAATYDVGDQIFQCGRHVDVFKLFLMWKNRGDVGMAKYVDDSIARNDLFNSVLQKRCKEFQPLLKQPSRVPCTCFFYIPKKLQKRNIVSSQETFNSETFPIYKFRKSDDEQQQNKETSELFDVFEKVTPRAKLLMMRRGSMVLTMSKMGDNIPNFWRFVANGAVSWSESQINDFLDEVADACESVYQELY